MQVTAVIPCHNHEAWVAYAVESVCRQDHPYKAVVVVDDGSTDRSFERVVGLITPDAATEYAGSGSYEERLSVRFAKGNTKNGVPIAAVRFDQARGPSFARNRGIELANELFDPSAYALLDSDDEYEQGKVSKAVAILAAHPDEVGAVYSDYDTVTPDGRRTREFKPNFTRRRLLAECIVNCDSVVSRKAVEAVGGFDETLRVAEDYDFWLRLSEKYVIVHVPESLVTIRVGGHSSTSTVAKQTWEANYARVMQKLRERAGATNH